MTTSDAALTAFVTDTQRRLNDLERRPSASGQMVEPLDERYTLSANTAPAGTGFRKVPFNTPRAGSTHMVSGGFDVPADGTYQVWASVGCLTQASTNLRYIATIYVNGAERSRGTDYTTGTTSSSGGGATVYDVLTLAEGDFVEVYSYFQTAVTGVTWVTALTYFAVRSVGTTGLIGPTGPEGPQGNASYIDLDTLGAVSSWTFTGASSVLRAAVLNGRWANIYMQAINTAALATGAQTLTICTLAAPLRPGGTIQGHGILYPAIQACRVIINATSGIVQVVATIPASQTQVMASIGYPLW